MDLLGALAHDFPHPVVIAQHRAPDSDDGRLADVLSNYSVLPVCEAEDKELLEPGRVYLAPADYHVLVDGNHIALAVDEPVNHSRPSIDVLFESAAAAFGSRTIAVLLTGLGSDGAAGIAAVRAAGRRTVVQEPASALRAAMPQAGVGAGAAGVGPLARIGLRVAA